MSGGTLGSIGCCHSLFIPSFLKNDIFHVRKLLQVQSALLYSPVCGVCHVSVLTQFFGLVVFSASFCTSYFGSAELLTKLCLPFWGGHWHLLHSAALSICPGGQVHCNFLGA